MISNNSIIENISKLHSKAYFTCEEAAEFLIEKFNEEISKYNDSGINESAVESFFMKYKYVCEQDFYSVSLLSIKRPNHYVFLSECKSELYIKHAGMLLLMDSIDELTEPMVHIVEPYSNGGDAF